MSSYEGHPDQKYGFITYSQHGEDLMLLNLLKLLDYKPNQSLQMWLDIGAHHPTDISNTKLLYDHGYRGVNVDANPNLITAFTQERSEDLNVNFGVGLRAGEGTFYMYSDTSGRNTFSTEEVKNLEGELQVQTTINLPIRTLNQIVDIFCKGVFPFVLSSDLEGLDFSVLSSANFGVSAPVIIVVETRREHTWRMVEMLRAKEYTALCRTGENLIFVHNNYYSRVF